MPVHFSDREMKRAWKNNFQAYELAQPKTNAHRLLLFYSVECGLKAAIMRGQSKTSTRDCQEIIVLGHSINRLLDTLKVEQNLRLPKNVQMKNDRQVSASDINQMWRYGGEAANNPTDQELEVRLLKISDWVREVLN